MSVTRRGEIADQALRDIAELDEQVAAGEIGPERAAELRRRYEAVASDALADAGPRGDPDDGRARPWRPGAWTWTYALAVMVALIAVVVLLPSALIDRPPGGAVTGVEATGADGSPPSVDPNAVSNEQLEEVVAANPQVVGMRLALADRYAAAGEDGRAMRHYLAALDQQPDNPDVLTRLSWLLLGIGQPGPALENVDRALAVQPDSVEAAWVQANVLVNGTGDRVRGIAVLERLAARGDLSSAVRSRVDELLAQARTGQGPR